MSKTLIIPDIHHKIGWIEPFLKKIEHDTVVFLGDYFDDFNDDEDITSYTANWLKNSLEIPNRIHLWGNHDVPYYNTVINCPGFTYEKYNVINKIIPKSYFEKKLKFSYYEQNFLFSHAGFSLESITYDPEISVDNKDELLKHIQLNCDSATLNLKNNFSHILFSVGKARGGLDKKGGCLWLDWDKEFKPLCINQIVGHTPDKNVRVKCEYNKSINICLDTYNSTFVGILENGKFSYINRETFEIHEI